MAGHTTAEPARALTPVVHLRVLCALRLYADTAAALELRGILDAKNPEHAAMIDAHDSADSSSSTASVKSALVSPRSSRTRKRKAASNGSFVDKKRRRPRARRQRKKTITTSQPQKEKGDDDADAGDDNDNDEDDTATVDKDDDGQHTPMSRNSKANSSSSSSVIDLDSLERRTIARHVAEYVESCDLTGADDDTADEQVEIWRRTRRPRTHPSQVVPLE